MIARVLIPLAVVLVPVIVVFPQPLRCPHGSVRITKSKAQIRETI